MKPLHITNGDVAAERIRGSILPGEVLPWGDLLHEGPVPSGLSLDEMSRVRARFIAGAMWGLRYEQLLLRFAERDRLLAAFKRSDEVVLWFEHDLVDQLQLLQILQWFARRESPRTRLSLICVREFPGVTPFRGLGQLSSEQIGSLWDDRAEVTVEQLELGRLGWEAFTADTPLRLQDLTEDDVSALPFLRPAIVRHLQQFPSTREGLSRTERQILDALDGDDRRLREVFRVSQYDREDAPFMADQAFLLHVARLGEGTQPLLRFADGSRLPDAGSPLPDDLWEREVESTDAGRQVLSGRSDRERFQKLDRWLGGVHLHGERAAWRWAHQRHAIVAQR
jgi:hypothetical protein